MTYRSPEERVADAPTLPKGPAAKCLGCGAERHVHSGSETLGEASGDYTTASGLYRPIACTYTRRVKIGWLRRCSEPGSHLHERCKVCGLKWLTSFAGEV